MIQPAPRFLRTPSGRYIRVKVNSRPKLRFLRPLLVQTDGNSYIVLRFAKIGTASQQEFRSTPIPMQGREQHDDRSVLAAALRDLAVQLEKGS